MHPAIQIAAAPDMLAVAERWVYFRDAIFAKAFEPNSLALTELLDATAKAVAKATKEP